MISVLVTTPKPSRLSSTFSSSHTMPDDTPRAYTDQEIIRDNRRFIARVRESTGVTILPRFSKEDAAYIAHNLEEVMDVYERLLTDRDRKLAIAAKVLRFYAEPQRYIPNDPRSMTQHECIQEQDVGRAARDAIAEITTPKS
jgi:hypothetical protein